MYVHSHFNWSSSKYFGMHKKYINGYEWTWSTFLKKKVSFFSAQQKKIIRTSLKAEHLQSSQIKKIHLIVGRRCRTWRMEYYLEPVHLMMHKKWRSNKRAPTFQLTWLTFFSTIQDRVITITFYANFFFYDVDFIAWK